MPECGTSMFSRIFIERPRLAAVVSLILLLAGGISLANLPVAEYPEIAPPTLFVSATYSGASADVVAQTVAMPLENEINGVEDLLYFSSTSSNSGSYSCSVTFRSGTDSDIALVNLQNAVKRAEAQLPSEVTKVGITVEKRGNDILAMLAFQTDGTSLSLNELVNYVNNNGKDALARLEGVSSSDMMSQQEYAMRIWMDPLRMSGLGISSSEIRSAVEAQNVQAAAGTLGAEGSNRYVSYKLNVQGRLKTAEEFGEIVVRSDADSGRIVRLRDVATVELGSSSYSGRSTFNGKESVGLSLYRSPDANALATMNRIKAELATWEQRFPPGVSYSIAYDPTKFIVASMREMVSTLVVALILVVLVTWLFIQDWRATLIPAVAIPVSLVGTFSVMYALGYSINTLTMFGLILVIGSLVDDAIVVVEAVQSKFDAGYKSPYLATKDAMGDVTMAIISCTCVFMAVFIPVTFMGGTSGVFYTQFGITMATAVGISMISALTLCPALCAIMMRPSDGTKSAKSINGRVRAAYNASFNAVLGKYKKGVMFFIRHRWMVWTSLVAAIVLLVYLMSTTKTGLVPQEDQGVIMVNVSTSPGSTLEETTKVMDKLEDILKHTPEIEHYSKVAGYGLMSGQGTSYGTIIIRLKDWSERKGSEHTSDAVVARLNAQFYGVKEAQIFSFQPGMIPGYGMGNSLELNLQDRTGGDRTVFYESVMQFLGALNQRPEVAMAYTSYAMNFPQVSVDVDAAKCKRAGISPSAVLDALGSYCGGAYISNYNQFGKVYRVMMQASPEYRLDEQALSNMFVRNGAEMAPVSQFVTLNRVLGPETANRFNLYSAISANVNPAEGYSSGEVQKVIEEVAEQTLPLGYGYEYGGMAREEASTGGAQTVFIYAVCIFLIYLILACLYESFLVPFAVIFSVPFGLMGSFLFAKVLGLENNIYLQTGVIMLIGLLAKTAILITEYAIERRRKGMGIVESAYSAAQVRLRPILMTVLTMIFGMLPLMFSSGAGANGNSSLGTGVVGGMLVGTLALLFVVPVFYIIFEYLQEKIRPPMEEEADVQVLLEKQKSEAERAKN